MTKQKIQTDNSQTFTLLEELNRKINFLNSMKAQSSSDSLLSSNVEFEFIDNGYAPLFDKIKSASHSCIEPLINAQLLQEEKAYSKLSKNVR